MARFIVGDIHGCWDSLTALVAQLHLAPGDRLWSTGDLVGGGPRSLEVLRWARTRHAAGAFEAVLGNHDLSLVARAAGIGKGRIPDELVEVASAADAAELLDWLRRRPLLVHDGEVVLVHAGLHPAWSLARANALAREVEAELASARWHELVARSLAWRGTWSDALGRDDRLACALDVFVTVRMVDADGNPCRSYKGPPRDAPPGLVPWFHDRAAEAARIVFGHWAALGLAPGLRHIGLDSGCAWGGALTAYDPDTGRFVAQPALEPIARGRR